MDWCIFTRNYKQAFLFVALSCQDQRKFILIPVMPSGTDRQTIWMLHSIDFGRCQMPTYHLRMCASSRGYMKEKISDDQ